MSGGGAATKKRSLMDSSTHQPAFSCTQENLDQVLHEENIAGLFVLCFSDQKDNDLHMKVYHGAMRQRWSMVDIANGQTMEWPQLQQQLAEQLKLPTPPLGLQPWAIFTPRGERVVDASTPEASDGTPLIGQSLVHQLGMGLLYQGGQFIWPGVSIGYEREISLYSVMPMGSPTFETSRNVTLETLSLVPLVLSVKGFLSESECDHIQVRISLSCGMGITGMYLAYAQIDSLTSLSFIAPLRQQIGSSHTHNGIFWRRADGSRQGKESIRL